MNANRKPVILITHSRSCSTILERIFWANNDIKCFHEHFGDAYYFGPEKVSENWKHWPEDRIRKTGKQDVTYKIALEGILGHRDHTYVFNKDMSYHIVPPSDSKIREFPSLKDWDDDDDDDDGASRFGHNPTWLPTSAIQSIRFAFLIRSPWLAVPSLYRLHVPPAVHETMEPIFRPGEIGYREMRVLIEYLYPHTRNNVDRQGSEQPGKAEMPILIDASDLLVSPEKMMHQLCTHVELPFSVDMLSWNLHNAEMEREMSKFPGFHTDAIASSGLRRRTKDEEDRANARGRATEHHEQDEVGMEMQESEYFAEWCERYGEADASKILEAVNICKEDYVWLRRLRMKCD